MNVGLYIAFFPQLIAGPIVRYETVAYEIENRKENGDKFTCGVVRFIRGLGKKVLIANNMAIVADVSFALVTDSGTNISVAMAWLGAIAYSFQIFFDFSGYSDMAIGLGRMFGFHFLENFNYPYISKSITEFWRRWHISLGTWFRDYVYIPLGGNRVGKYRLVINLFVVWLLTGIWHGANWTFIIWGLLYFSLLFFEKITGLYKKDTYFGYIYTMFFVIIGWVLFRSDSIGIAVNYIAAMFGKGAVTLFDDKFILYILEFKYYFIAAIIFSIPIKDILVDKCSCKIASNFIYSIGRSAFYLIIFIISISFVIKGSYNPFIYFNF